MTNLAIITQIVKKEISQSVPNLPEGIMSFLGVFKNEDDLNQVNGSYGNFAIIENGDTFTTHLFTTEWLNIGTSICNADLSNYYNKTEVDDKLSNISGGTCSVKTLPSFDDEVGGVV